MVRYPALILAGLTAGLLLRAAVPVAESGPKPMKSPMHDDSKAKVKATPEQRRAGADARAPHQIPPAGWWHVLKRAGAGFTQDRVMAEAAGVTFYTLLALFPAIASFISIYGLFNDPSSLNDQLDNLAGIIPAGGLDIIKGQITALTAHGHKTLGFAAIIGFAVSLWSANSGVKSLFDALNVVYHEHEKRGFVRVTLTAFIFTIGGILFLIAALLSVVVLPIVLSYIGLGNETALLLSAARWPVMLVVLMIGLAVLYRYGPSRNLARWQWVSWGGGVAAIGWIIISILFSFYVSNFGTYDKTYGSLGAVVAFMTWIWISGIVILMGAEINAELEQQTEQDSTIGPEKPLGHRGAYKADTKV